MRQSGTASKVVNVLRRLTGIAAMGEAAPADPASTAHPADGGAVSPSKVRASRHSEDLAALQSALDSMPGARSAFRQLDAVEGTLAARGDLAALGPELLRSAVCQVRFLRGQMGQRQVDDVVQRLERAHLEARERRLTAQIRRETKARSSTSLP